jgi:hypothetical protein
MKDEHEAPVFDALKFHPMAKSVAPTCTDSL